MPYCGECGTKLEEGARFCASCGAQQDANGAKASQYGYTPPTGYAPQGGSTGYAPQGGYAPSKPKPNGRMFALIGGGIALVLVVAVLILTGAFQSRTAKFKKMHRTLLFNPLAEGFSEIVGATEGSGLKFSDTLTLSGSISGTGSDEQVAAILDDSSLVLRTDFDGGKKQYTCELDLVAMGDPLLTAFIEAADGYLKAYVPAIDSAYYGVDYKAFIENNADLFPPRMVSYLDPAELIGLTESEAEALVKRYANIVLDTVNRNNLTAKNETVELFDGDENVKCRVYTFTPGEEDYRELLTALFDTAKEDEQVKSLVFMGWYSEEPDAREVFEESWDEWFEEYEDAMDDLIDQLVDSEITYTAAVKGSRIHQLKLEMGNMDTSLCYDSFGKTLSERTDAIYAMTDDEVMFEIVNAYTRSGKSVEGKLNMTSEVSTLSEASLTYALEIGKTSGLGLPYGTYSVKLPGTEMRMSMYVERGEDGGSDHRFDVSVYGTRVNLLINTADDPADISEPSRNMTDITDYDQDELAELVPAWTEEIQMLFTELIMSSMYE